VTDALASFESSSPAGSEKRRTSRIPMSIPITVSGVDALGEPFRELTTTLSVSCNGCKYKSKNYVQRDSLVTIELSHANPRVSPRVIKGRARWVQRPRNLREQYEIGLELLVSGNVWGLASPPPDWFPHPDDEAMMNAHQERVLAEIAPPAAPVVARPAIVEADDFDAAEAALEPNESARLRPHAFEEIDIEGAIGFTPEEVESAPPAPADLNTRLQEIIRSSLKTMVDRIAEAAATDLAGRVTTVIEEARLSCEASAVEFEERVREALDDVLNPRELDELTASAEKQGKKRARKAARKRARQDEANDDSR